MCAALSVPSQSEGRAESAAQTRRRRTLGRCRNAREHPQRAFPLPARCTHERTRTAPRLPCRLHALRALLEMLAPERDRFFEMRGCSVDLCAEIVGDDLRHDFNALLDVEQRRAHARLLDLRLGRGDEILRETHRSEEHTSETPVTFL